MRVEKIMTTTVQSITPEIDVAVAKAQMKQAGIRHLVVMRDGQVLGIVSERDLIRVRPRLVDERWTVEDVMTSRVVIAAPETTVREAANLLRGHVIGCLPIIDGQRLVGIVTTSDLLDLIGRDATADRLRPPPATSDEALLEEDQAPLIRS